MSHFDVAIVGAGIAGAGLAAEIGARASVLMLEAEDRPGYHATGRSAAFWSETYGGPLVQPLTTASGPELRAGGYLDPLGSLHIGRVEDAAARDAFLAEFDGSGVALVPVDPHARVAGLRAEWTLGVFEPSCAYIDVGALHGDYLKKAARGGVTLVLDAALGSLTREGTRWLLETRAGRFTADIVVNAAGAWADEVARMAGARPIGITAYRRTMVQLRTEPPTAPGMPHVTRFDGAMYFKPEAGGKLWLSPHDESRVPPGDVAPEEIDVATAIDRLEHTVDWRVVALERKWAGLRSFAPDRLPVFGFDPVREGFFWCAGQGGFGIQTAPAAAKLAAASLLGGALDESVSSIDPAIYSAARFAA
ncbi:NAD(P)/FAD-dependent oxidoreductase [Stakelama tenebrarum]|uniref:FAD-binding oxidoreductase n=1 Tax=Stakelama tenebrarum TaxID=2711215 RepID=A0A6G6Y2M3_9SPHN|nr:FAD-binding oxidoreductase [Sphingosinithalassobacter tenebrarum]QIG79149.1 FAD-binding oxidoreductase [Sphingosinithalassobacter tenebrarum]